MSTIIKFELFTFFLIFLFFKKQILIKCNCGKENPINIPVYNPQNEYVITIEYERLEKEKQKLKDEHLHNLEKIKEKELKMKNEHKNEIENMEKRNQDVFDAIKNENIKIYNNYIQQNENLHKKYENQLIELYKENEEAKRNHQN